MENNSMNNLFEELLKESAALAAKELGEEILQGEKAELSSEHQARMKKMFAAEKRKIRIRKFGRYASRAAAILVVMGIASGAVVFNVDAFRFRFLSMFTKTEPTNTEISFHDGTSYSNGNITIGYVPEGFELDTEKITESLSILKFKKDTEYFTITVRDTYSSISVDTENAKVEKIEINGFDVFYSEKSGDNIFEYYIDDCAINILSNMEKEVLIQVIKNIKIN